ncbi:MAG TPA: M23 family metallopeptidase [Anaeromyxobacteraceae bacterium]|nr:M23 family metallopeptidase [Anaeromyxobacteraceae bacterium]
MPAAALTVTLLLAAAPAPPGGAYSDDELLAFDEPEPEPAPPAADPAPARGPAGGAVDAALLRFAADERTRRAALPPAHAFSAALVQAWDDLARALEGWLAVDTSQAPFASLVRARVTLEAELEFDRRRFGEPPPRLAARLDDAVARLARRALAARAMGERLFVASRPPALRWPIDDAGLSSAFGVRLHPIDHVRRMHWGIDLAAPPGRVVSSAAAGWVVHAGYTPGYGLTVEVRHAGELTSRYGHLSHLLCAPGDRLDAGQTLGLVGATGRATGPHLHFEVWRGGRAEDPLALLGGRWAPGS